MAARLTRLSRPRPLPLLAAAVAASPIVIAALSLVGDSWFPVGDLSSMLFRTSQVGTTETPLVGSETIKGWAHPGPLHFYLAAPLYRLTGGDPRSLLWTAGVVNVAVVGGIAAMGWRRGRWPLLLALATLVAVVIHGLGPDVTVDPWNPYLPLLPFLLTVLLVWDVSLGDRRALPWAALSATVAAQAHLAFATLGVVLVAWLMAWSLWWPRLVGRRRDAGTAADDGSVADLPRPLLRGWWRSVRFGLAAVGLLWLPPVLDALFDMHNPWQIAKSVATPPDTVGPVDAVSLVGRYVRPDGPWMGGAEPELYYSVVGSGPAPLIFALAVLAACLYLGRRRGLVDVVALTSLTLTLVLGAIPATSQIFLPVYAYLTQFLKLVGGLVWFTVAWTVWRVVQPHLRLPVHRSRQVVLATAAAAGLVAAAVWSWGDATDIPTANPTEEAVVQDVRSQVRRALPRDGRILVEHRGDGFNIAGPGVIYWMIHDGYDVLTTDGDHGLKWGHPHRWQPGESYDRLITVAVHDGRNSPYDAFRQCEGDRHAELIASHDTLTGGERQWLDDFLLRYWAEPSSVSSREVRRAERLQADGLRIGVFEGPRVCAREPRRRPPDAG